MQNLLPFPEQTKGHLTEREMAAHSSNLHFPGHGRQRNVKLKDKFRLLSSHENGK